MTYCRNTLTHPCQRHFIMMLPCINENIFSNFSNVISDKGIHLCPTRSWCIIVQIQIKTKHVFIAPENKSNIEFQKEMNIKKGSVISGFSNPISFSEKVCTTKNINKIVIYFKLLIPVLLTVSLRDLRDSCCYSSYIYCYILLWNYLKAMA